MLLLAACAGKEDQDSAATGDGGAVADGGASTDGGSDGDGGEPAERWTGTANVQVVDIDGQPVAEAWVMMGGAAEEAWVLTDAEGLASIEVTDDGITDRYLLAGKVGWISGGENLRETQAPDDPVIIELPALPDADNADYSWQPGGNSDSPDSSECGHCHLTIGDDWADSTHRDAARNSRTWDLYTGSASELASADCAELGGWLADGVDPGSSGGTVERCYTGQGVLPLLNDGCGGAGQPACDHPDQQPLLDAFGSCGDCHSPAVDGGQPGAIDLSATTGIAYDEGVTCDFCHKVASVEPGGAPGLDGAISLRRPSEPTMVTGQEYDPITFGPYPDVIVAIMKGSYAPQMRESDWCSACHEYARGSFSDALPVDSDRWPAGLPLHETWSELQVSPYAMLGTTCHDCHMQTLAEESSTYDISETGLNPSVDQGWLRAEGEVRHHDFPASGELDPPGFDLDVDWDDGQATVEVEIFNDVAGHALPTGEPLRQLLVLVEAVDAKGQPGTAWTGRTVPDVGGYAAQGVLGDDASLDGSSLRLDGAELPADLVTVRIVRASGTWADDDGPGTGWLDELSAEDKGLPLYDLVAQVDVVAVDGDSLTLADAPAGALPGDRVYLCAADDFAGAPGWLYAKTLVDMDGSRGVAHYRAVDIASDNRIASGAMVTTAWTVDAPGGSVSARLVHRRYAAPVASAYGWERGDREVALLADEDDSTGGGGEE